MAKKTKNQDIPVNVVSANKLQSVELLKDFLSEMQSNRHDGVIAFDVDGDNVRTLIVHLAPNAAKLTSENVVERLSSKLHACLQSLDPHCLTKDVVHESNKAVTDVAEHPAG